MNTKMISAIEEIDLYAATFHNVSITPTLINFIYGNNGTGKSTIAREIGANSGIYWQDGKSVTDYSVLIYNLEFVDANFRNYGSLKGVFTVGERNIQIQNSIAENTMQKSEQDRLGEVANHRKKGQRINKRDIAWQLPRRLLEQDKGYP